MREFLDEHMARLGYEDLAPFARYLGIDRPTLSRMYHGHQLPMPKTARKLAARLDVSVEEVPQFDPRGASPKAARLLEEEVAELRARVEELEAALRSLADKRASPGRPAVDGRGRSRSAKAAP